MNDETELHSRDHPAPTRTTVCVVTGARLSSQPQSSRLYIQSCYLVQHEQTTPRQKAPRLHGKQFVVDVIGSDCLFHETVPAVPSGQVQLR